MLDLLGVQGVRLEAGGTEPAENTHFSTEREMKIIN
jgi:hypothetical protein